MPEACVEEIPELHVMCSEEVRAAAAMLVNAKHELDRLSQSAAGALIVAQAYPHDHPGQTISPFDFACSMFPFFKYCRPTVKAGKRYKALVPTRMVIGESWRWRPEHLHDTDRAKAVKITHDAFSASSPAHAKAECPQYFFIAPLGILVAHEAKNRVALFRELAIPHIPALVSDEYYPAADRIRLFSLQNVDLAVLDGHIVERVQSLRLSANLLHAYGIAIESKWPGEFPELARVISELDRPRYGEIFHSPVADLHQLNIDEQAENIEVKATLCDVEAVNLPKLTAWLQLVVAVPVLMLALEFCKPWPDIKMALAALLGAVLMLLSIPALPLARCKVRDLRDPVRRTQLVNRKQKLSSDRRAINPSRRDTTLP